MKQNKRRSNEGKEKKFRKRIPIVINEMNKERLHHVVKQACLRISKYFPVLCDDLKKKEEKFTFLHLNK